MEIVATSDNDLTRWPIGHEFACDQFASPDPPGCGTTFKITERADFKRKRGQYGAHAVCPNCQRSVYLDRPERKLRADTDPSVMPSSSPSYWRR